ncbi:ABC multidrug transporter B [Paramyrothecium foliicola]|nr:ABC multidrug transporter B [Paramyrothecium foliicola]
MKAGCWSQNDETWGPQVLGCRGNFDFTIHFEEVVFIIVPASIAILCMLLRFRQLQSQSVLTHAGSILAGAWVCLSGLQIALLILWALPASPRTSVSIPAAALDLLPTLGATILSPLEHRSAVRPSAVLSAYLFITILLDVAVTRTLWLALGKNAIPGVFTARLALKTVILVLESLTKTKLLCANNENSTAEDTGNIFSRILFLWLNPLLWKGNRHNLSLEDLPKIGSDLSRAEGFSETWKHDAHKSDRHRLLKVLFTDLKWAILAGTIPRLGVIGFKYVQPFMTRRMVRWLDEPLSTESQNEGYGLIAAFGLVFVGLALSNSRYQHLSYRLVVMIRTRMVSVIYQKTFNMDLLQGETRAPITLMSTDVERISYGLGFLHDVWGSVVEVAIAIWLLWRELHVYSSATMIIASMCVVTALVIGKLTGRRQQAWIEAVQRRIAVTSSALPHLKDIKSAGMVETITSVLEKFRLDEVKASKKWRRLTVLMVAVGFYNSALAPVISFTSYVLTSQDANGVLTLDKAMTVLTIFALFGAPLNMLSESASGLFSGIACIERIRRFLVLPDQPQSKERLVRRDKHMKVNEDMTLEKTTTAIALTNAIFKWNAESELGLNGLTLTIEKATVTVIIGPVGCGKSTLLHGLLSENYLVQGNMFISSSRIAYCSQTPWLTNATLRENVIGCTPFNEARYQEVVRCCGLVSDISSLANGDQTKLGNGGSVISGGQKQRVALARAAYSSADILLLDDVLSGLDSITVQYVLRNLIGSDGLLHRQRRTVVLASSSRNCLGVADKIIWLDRTGHMPSQDTVVDFAVLSSSSVFPDQPKIEEQQPTATSNSLADERQPSQLEHALEHRKGDWRVLQYYILRTGSKGMVLYAIFMVVFTFFYGFAPVWVELWAQSSGKRLNMHVGIYYMIAVSQILFIGIAAGYLLLVLLPRASVTFHHILLKVTTHAPLSFLTRVDVGIATNRFSQDLQLIDTELPISLFNTTLAFAYCILLLVIICVSSRYIAAILPFFLAIMFFLQRSYLHSSRQIRLLDLAAKAPLFSHFAETLDGLATLRALGWQTPYEERLRDLLTTSQRPFYTLYCVQRWLNLVIDLIIAAVAIIFAGTAVALHGSLSTGLVGLALINIITFNGNIRVLVVQYTNLETSIAAVARIRAYEKVTPSEVDSGEEQEVPHDWPQQGKLEIIQASASYVDRDSLILKNVSLTIPAGSKVGICGRSGSGKSSLFAVLLRMLDLQRGSVILDDINIADVSRSKVRSRLNALPQEPYLIPNTSVRACIDPFSQLEDGDITSILKEVQLWEDLGSIEAVLDMTVNDNLLSHGQRQLLSLGRAVARRASTGKILLLDEVTSQLDPETEEIVRQVIRRNFSDHTVISIAHRLDMIVDYDIIVVLEDGNVIEKLNMCAAWARLAVGIGESNTHQSHHILIVEDADAAMLLDELDNPLEDVVLLDHQVIADCNASNILPQSESVIEAIQIWLNPTNYAKDGSEYQKHISSRLEGTCQWILELPVFLKWHENHGSGMLWIRDISKVYCVIDALDEMEASNLETFLGFLDQLISSQDTELSIIDIRLDKALMNPDISAYLWDRPQRSQIPQGLHATIVDGLIKKGDGLFLYASLAITNICEQRDKGEALETLSTLPCQLVSLYTGLLNTYLQRTGTPEATAYPGSIWHGCVDFGSEQKNWKKNSPDDRF